MDIRYVTICALVLVSSNLHQSSGNKNQLVYFVYCSIIFNFIIIASRVIVLTRHKKEMKKENIEQLNVPSSKKLALVGDFQIACFPIHSCYYNSQKNIRNQKTDSLKNFFFFYKPTTVSRHICKISIVEECFIYWF